jgi:dihydrolipoamide dehydrogenase
MVVGEFTQETQLLVIGGGPGGYSAAFRAAELGVQTVLVDARSTLGGECLHAGCIPSKTLLHLASVIRQAREADALGLAFDEPRIDLARTRAWIDATIERLAKGLDGRARDLGVERLDGTARFEDAKRVAIHGGDVPRVKFRRAIIATGSRPSEHPVLRPDGERIWDPAQALRVPEIPARLLVVGGDYIAIELAEIYVALGSRVTLVHPEPELLADADRDVLRPLERRLASSLEAVHAGTDVADVAADGRRLRVTLAGTAAAEPEPFDAVILSAPRRGCTSGLGLEQTGVELDEHGFIRVDATMRTTDPRLLAVGDGTGPPCLADRALVQGRVAGEVVAGQPSAFDAAAIPFVMFSEPEVAWCGLTERAAAAGGIPVVALKVPWGASGRAVGMGAQHGLTKILYDPASNIILGAAICGRGACELIAEVALAVEMGCELGDLADTMHPHPTLAELLSDAARQALAQSAEASAEQRAET